MRFLIIFFYSKGISAPMTTFFTHATLQPHKIFNIKLFWQKVKLFATWNLLNKHKLCSILEENTWTQKCFWVGIFWHFWIIRHYFAIFHHNARCRLNIFEQKNKIRKKFTSHVCQKFYASSWIANHNILTSLNLRTWYPMFKLMLSVIWWIFNKFSLGNKIPQIAHCARIISSLKVYKYCANSGSWRKNIINIKNKHLMM